MSGTSRPLLIVNPKSGGGRTERLWSDLRRPIEHALGPCETVFTERSGHAADLAREAAAQGRERIVAVGGDGTFSEVCSGVLESKGESAVGLLHQGTGGDFRRSLGLEHRLDQYLAAIARNAPRRIDAGHIRHTDRAGNQVDRHFVNVASLGMGGLVDKYVGEGSRLVGGSAAYLAAALKSLVNGAVGNLRLDLTHEGRTETVRLRSRIVAICNGRYFGGGMQIAPMAKLDDGVFEIVAMGGEHRLPLLSAMAAVYSGEHLSKAGVAHLRASEITIHLENTQESERFLLDVDGEWAGGAPVTIRVLPGALRVLV